MAVLFCLFDWAIVSSKVFGRYMWDVFVTNGLGSWKESIASIYPLDLCHRRRYIQAQSLTGLCLILIFDFSIQDSLSLEFSEQSPCSSVH